MNSQQVAKRTRAENTGAGLGVLAVFVVMFNTLPNPLWTIISTGIFAAVVFTCAHIRDRRRSPVADPTNWSTLASPASFWSGLPRPIPRGWLVRSGQVSTQGRREIAHLRIDDQHGEEHWYLMTRMRLPIDRFQVRWQAAPSTGRPDGAESYVMDRAELPDSLRAAFHTLPAAASILGFSPPTARCCCWS